MRHVLFAARAAVVSIVASFAPLMVIASMSACAAVADGGDLTEADLARGRTEEAPGARGFAGQCARCHGSRGEGLAGIPAILGSRALPEYPRELATAGAPGLRDPEQMEIDSQTQHAGLARRGPFRNGQDLYAFLKMHVRRPRRGGLSDEDYAAIAGFMIAVQGGALPEGGLTVDNAQTIAIPQR